jgi:hypothetical protein
MALETPRQNALWRRLTRSWFELTVAEQKVALLVLSLFLLGLAVRTWRLVWAPASPNPPIAAASSQPSVR